MKVLKFGAVWCNSCLVMRPRWAQIEKENPWLETQYLDFDGEQKMIKHYHINEGILPVFIFLDKTGKEFLRRSGEIPKEELLKIILKNRNR